MILSTDTVPADLERRFGGLARLYGIDGAKRIRAAHIVVVGIGGVGSWAAEAAARSGVAHLTLIDLDHVSESNINRQAHALDNTVGQAKVQAMRERIARINPQCQVSCIEEFVDETNWPGLLMQEGMNAQGTGASELAVIDACDQVRAKTAIAAWAIQQKIMLISIGAAGGKRMAHRVEIEDLSAVTHDPLLAQMRYRLRKGHHAARQGKIGVACVFSREAVLQTSASNELTEPLATKSGDPTDEARVEAVVEQTDGSLNCHGYGSVVSVTASFGFCAAGWVLSKLAEQSRISQKITL